MSLGDIIRQEVPSLCVYVLPITLSRSTREGEKSMVPKMDLDSHSSASRASR